MRDLDSRWITSCLWLLVRHSPELAFKCHIAEDLPHVVFPSKIFYYSVFLPLGEHLKSVVVRHNVKKAELFCLFCRVVYVDGWLPQRDGDGWYWNPEYGETLKEKKWKLMMPAKGKTWESWLIPPSRVTCPPPPGPKDILT
jgi:hypothetical protein